MPNNDKNFSENIRLPDLDIPLGFFDFDKNKKINGPQEMLHQFASAIVNELIYREIISTDTIELKEIGVVEDLLHSAYELKRMEDRRNPFSNDEIRTAAINALSVHSVHNEIQSNDRFSEGVSSEASLTNVPKGKNNKSDIEVALTTKEKESITREASISMYFYNNPEQYEEYLTELKNTVIAKSSSEGRSTKDRGDSTQIRAVSMAFGIPSEVLTSFVNINIDKGEGQEHTSSQSYEPDPVQNFFSQQIMSLVRFFRKGQEGGAPGQMKTISVKDIEDLEAKIAKTTERSGEKYSESEIRTAAINTLSKATIKKYENDIKR